jgi:hypothetical protein
MRGVIIKSLLLATITATALVNEVNNSPLLIGSLVLNHMISLPLAVMVARGSRNQNNRRDLLLPHEKTIQNHVIQLSWTAVIKYRASCIINLTLCRFMR